MINVGLDYVQFALQFTNTAIIMKTFGVVWLQPYTLKVFIYQARAVYNTLITIRISTPFSDITKDQHWVHSDLCPLTSSGLKFYFTGRCRTAETGRPKNGPMGVWAAAARVVG